MNKYCISQHYTLKETIEVIEEFKNRVALVVNDEKKVVGVISQGDIIRALISGKSLFSLISNIMTVNFFYLNSVDYAKAYEIFKKFRISLLPVVDDQFHLINVIDLNDIFNYLEGK